MSNLKEKIIAINVEIEDKDKVIVLLERKLELARASLSDIDEIINAQYQRQIQQKVHEHKQYSNELSTETQNVSFFVC
jgi:hypothetical protein